jgi:hypothetical protein
MASTHDSSERIAADILIAAMSNVRNLDAVASITNPRDIPEHYQKIFEAVFNAQTKALDNT